MRCATDRDLESRLSVQPTGTLGVVLSECATDSDLESGFECATDSDLESGLSKSIDVRVPTTPNSV